MKKEDFVIGHSFWLTGHEYRCTDIGSRVITAIKLGKVNVTTLKVDENGHKKLTRHETEDKSWFNGPPYAVCEQVFDEYEQEVCYPTWEKWQEAYPEIKK